MIFTILFSVSLISFVSSTTTDVSPCGSNITMPKDVRIGSCIEMPCYFPQFTKQSIQVDFEVPNDVKEMKHHIIASVMGNDMDVSLMFSTSPCKHITNGYCPLDKEEEVTYEYGMLIIYPPISVGIRFAIQDSDTEKDIFCFEFQIVVS